MSSKLIFLHIGRGKTGTTAIQEFCTRNREMLRRAGVRYLESGDGFPHGPSGHQSFAKSLLDGIPDWMQAPPDLDAIQGSVREELLNSPDDAFLISSENLTLVDPTAAKDFFANILPNARFKIIFYARSQDELAESQYNTNIRWLRVTAAFSDYLASGGVNELEYDALLAPWEAAFGRENILAHVYDVRGRSVIDDFLSCLQLTGPAPQGLCTRGEAATANESIGFRFLEVFRFLNSYDLADRPKLYASIHELLGRHDTPCVIFLGSGSDTFPAAIS